MPCGQPIEPQGSSRASRRRSIRGRSLAPIVRPPRLRLNLDRPNSSTSLHPYIHPSMSDSMVPFSKRPPLPLYSAEAPPRRPVMSTHNPPAPCCYNLLTRGDHHHHHHHATTHRPAMLRQQLRPWATRGPSPPRRTPVDSSRAIPNRPSAVSGARLHVARRGTDGQTDWGAGGGRRRLVVGVERRRGARRESERAQPNGAAAAAAPQHRGPGATQHTHARPTKAPHLTSCAACRTPHQPSRTLQFSIVTFRVSKNL